MDTHKVENAGAISDLKARTDLLNRLRRAEGQLRGIQRMVDEGEDCMKIGQQFSAVRKALDSTYIHMAMCFLKQKINLPQPTERSEVLDLETVLDDFTTLIARLR